MTAKTPLYEAHRLAGGQLVNFHGWEMPVNYGSQLDEHHAVRNDVGMFDVSHMTILDVLGAGGRQFLRHLLSNDVDTLEHNGKALYTCMCNEQGGIIDDLIVYQRTPDNYRLVLNSATREHDLNWIQEKSQDFAVGLQERSELSMIAVQGPNTFNKLAQILSPAQLDPLSTLTPFECVEIDDWFFARTGYTGEDGFEILVPTKKIHELWTHLLHAGIKPCGLGARDTLRLEAGMLLYGQDMDESTTPLESGLAWTIKWEPQDRNFIGQGALLSQKERGINRKLVGLVLNERGIMRSGQTVVLPDSPQHGIITSGTYSPTLEKSIAFARVPVEVGSEVLVDIRGKLFKAEVTKPRFVKQGKIL